MTYDKASFALRRNSKAVEESRDIQGGAATLLLAVIILFLITIVVLFTTKVGMLELKTSSNSVRATEAFHAAQAGLDYGITQYSADNTFASASRNVVSGSLASFVVTATSNADGSISLESTGTNAEGTASAVVEEIYGFVPVAGFGSLPPLMANGDFNPLGNITVIANPDGGGEGVPLSGWIDTVASGGAGGGSFQTCERDEFLYGDNNTDKAKETYQDSDGNVFYGCTACECDVAAGQLCIKDDLVAGDCSDFAIDGGGSNMTNAFKNLFGVEEADWEVIYGISMKVACNDLSTTIGDPFYDPSDEEYYNKPPIVWVEEDCSVGDVASFAKPIILVVDGDFTMNGNNKIFGIVFAFERPGTNITFQVNGGPTLYGALLTNSDVNLGNGNYTLHYAPLITDKLGKGGKGYDMAVRKPGSWKDY